MKNFFLTFKKTFTDGKFYHELLGESSFRNVLVYALKLALFFSLVISVVMLVIIYASGIKGKLKTSIYQTIPVDFVATIKDNKFSINKPEPYIIPLKNIDAFSSKKYARENLIYIDTNLDLNTDLHKTYSSMLIISKDKFSFENESDGKITIFPLKDFANTEITQTGLLIFVDRIFSVSWILAIVAVIPLTFMNFFSILFAGLFAGILVLILALIFKQRIKFKQSIIVSVYAYSVFGLFVSLFFFQSVNLFWPKVIATSILVLYFIANKNHKDVDSLSVEGNSTTHI